jgi:glycosyltransferase involved in cell wall biosynthesis
MQLQNSDSIPGKTNPAENDLSATKGKRGALSIAISSIHPTTEYSEWSGTPFCITKAFGDQVKLVAQTTTPLNSKLLPIARRLARVAKIRFGRNWRKIGRCDHLTYEFDRFFSRKQRSRELALANPGHVLHIGSRHLPIDRDFQNCRQYLFDDAPLSFWKRSGLMDGFPEHEYRWFNNNLKKIYSKIDHFFPVSEFMKELLVEDYGIDPARITPVGTGTGRIEPCKTEKDYENFTLLFVSKNEFKLKGGDLAVEGFRIARQSIPNAKLIMVGREEYAQFASEPGISVFPFVTFEVLQNLFHDSSAFIMPARSEPWGLVYLEALASKMPIIGLNRNSLPEITDHGRFGFLAENPAPGEVAEQIIKAYNMRAQLPEIGAAAQKYCLSRYSWDNVATKMISTMYEYNQ